MREITFNLEDSEFDKFMNYVKRSLKSAQNLQSKQIAIEDDFVIPQWQKDELDKSLKEIEDGTAQFEDWSIVRKRLFDKYNVK